MADQPNRVNVFICTKRDKYGAGVDVHIGGESSDEVRHHITEMFGEEVVEQVRTLVENQTAYEFARFTSDTFKAALKNLEEGGVGFDKPAPKQGGGGGAPSGDGDRALGVDGVTGAEVKVFKGKFGWSVTDGTTYSKLFPEDKPDSITLERASKLLANKREYDAKRAS